MNFKNKSTGQLSLITYFMDFASCALSTLSINQINDDLYSNPFILATILNGQILLQILFYYNKTKKKLK